MTALVIDIVVAHQALLRAQATADASALAAALDIDDAVAAAGKGKEYAARNYGVTDADWASCVDSEALAVATSVNCISVDDADSPTHIRVRIPDRIVPSFFASVLGYDSFSVSATAVAEVEYVVTSGGDPGRRSDPLADDVRSGDPGAGYPPCDEIPDWDGYPDSRDKWTEFILVFEHLDGTTTTICDTSRADGGGNTAFVEGVGGTPDNPSEGFFLHVSCSDIFLNGWTNPSRFAAPFGPLDGIDTNWRIIRYRIDKWNKNEPAKKCVSDFTPIFSDPPVIEPTIRLSQ